MKLDKKRRQECRTNYTRRLILLKSSHPRLVVRKTNRYLIVQIIESKHAQDKVIFSVNTKDLLKHGWPENKSGSLKSVTAGYLAGYLIGKKAKNVSEVILDLGLIPNTSGSRVYSVVKGVSDSGVKINFDKKLLLLKIKLKQRIQELILIKLKGV